MSYPLPNMGLLGISIGTDTGLTIEQDANTNYGLIDQHNHSSGYGVPIQPNGLDINTTLPFNDNNASSVKSVIFSVQSNLLSGYPYTGCLYAYGFDLYFNDVNGNQIQMTKSGAVNATATSIQSGTASASFSGGVLVVISATGVPGVIDTGGIIVRPTSSDTYGVTLSAPSGLATNYSLTLPTALPSNPGVLAVDTGGNLSYQEGGGVPTGTLLAFGGSSAPTGYLLCNGAAVSRTTYSNLFSVISTAFGSGNGSTTFNVPSMARSVPMGAGGSGTSTIGNAVGDIGGEENHTLTNGELASHSHTMGNHTHGPEFGDEFAVTPTGVSGGTATPGGSGGDSIPAFSTGAGSWAYPNATSGPSTNSTDADGGGSGHNTIQPSVIVNYIIKT